MFGFSLLFGDPEWDSDLFKKKKKKKAIIKKEIMVAGIDIMWVCHINQSPHLILMAAQRFTPAAEFWVWSLPGPNEGQASSPLWRIHLAWSGSTSLSQEHRPCSKLQRSTNPISSILLLLANKNWSVSTKCTKNLKAEVGIRILFSFGLF